MPVEMLHEGMTAEEIVEKFDVSPAAARVCLDTYVLTHWKFCFLHYKLVVVHYIKIRKSYLMAITKE